MSESQAIVNVSSQLISYPTDGGKKTGAQAGKYVLDFVQGLVVAPDGSTESMSTSLVKTGSKFVSSVYLTVSSVDAIIKIGQNTLPKSHQLTYVVNGISFDTMEITFPTDRTPLNDFTFSVIASNSQFFPIQLDTLISNHQPTTQTGETVNAYGVIMDFIFTGYSQITLISENIDGANSMTLLIELSEDGTNWISMQGYPVNLAFGEADIFSSTIKSKYFRARLKSTTTDLHADYRMSGNLEK